MNPDPGGLKPKALFLRKMEKKKKGIVLFVVKSFLIVIR